MFVTFEGGEGVGKSTQLTLLKERFAKPAIFTREPGGTVLAEKLRPLFLSEDLNPVEELLWILAMRKHHMDHVLRPALKEGKYVFCDRYIDSTLVYQGMTLGQDTVLAWHQQVGIDLWPDITFVFYDEQRQGVLRKDQHDCHRFEKKSQDFHDAVDSAYRQLVERFPQRCHLLPMSLGQEALHQKILDVLERSSR